MTRRHFTLIEILIVLILVGLVLAVAAPRLMKRSERIAKESALTAIRSAVNETAMRSRATGQALTLTLDPDESLLTVAEATDSLEHTWTPPKHDNGGENEDAPKSFIQAKPSYQLPKDIQWTPDDQNFNDDGAIVFTFFPDGQAAARAISFTIGDTEYSLQIDRITADPVILEFLD